MACAPSAPTASNMPSRSPLRSESTGRPTARLSFGLANVLATYRRWLDERGHPTPLTYAMEGIVFDRQGSFHEWLWPLIDACDVVALNAYPMDEAAWFTFGAFAESRRFLQDPRVRHDRLAQFEVLLRRALQQLEQAGKPALLSETGFPSAIGYHLEGDRLVVPESDNERYAEAMHEFAALLHRVNAEYGGRIRALYFYEWRDNLYHQKILNRYRRPPAICRIAHLPLQFPGGPPARRAHDPGGQEA